MQGYLPVLGPVQTQKQPLISRRPGSHRSKQVDRVGDPTQALPPYTGPPSAMLLFMAPEKAPISVAQQKVSRKGGLAISRFWLLQCSCGL